MISVSRQLQETKRIYTANFRSRGAKGSRGKGEMKSKQMEESASGIQPSAVSSDTLGLTAEC
jgi:hypothetical protein